MKPSTPWSTGVELPRFPALAGDLVVDVIVVGGGITGITAAWLLTQQGLRVALLERHRCAQQDTGHTTAHLTTVLDQRWRRLRRTFGQPAARAVAAAGTAAIDQICAVATAEEIECGFTWVPGYLHAATGAREAPALRAEARTAIALGLRAAPVASVPIFQTPGVLFPNQAKFHPLAYLAGLLRRLPARGCHIFEQSGVTRVDSDPLCVHAAGGRVRGGYLVLATHTPLTGESSLLGSLLFQTKLALYTSYALEAGVRHDGLPEACFWDTGEPYSYLRVDRVGRHARLIYGGEDHKTGQEPDTPAAFRRLADRLRHFVPEARVERQWSGQVIETHDGLPLIGEVSDRQFLATGYAGNGMTFGTLAAMMAVDACFKRRSPWQALFSPARKKLSGAWSYVTENKDYPYYLVRDRLRRGGASTETVPAGGGSVLRIDGQHVAAYRDGAGALTLCSAVCPHLGCIVRWNPAERTWDCPCHGSRFGPTGEVLAGPAESSLTPIAGEPAGRAASHHG